MKTSFTTNLLAASMILTLFACQQEEKSNAAPAKESVKVIDNIEAKVNKAIGITSLAEKAEKISKKYIIADLHVDVPYRLENKYDDISKATDGGDFDYPRAKAGGLSAPFMSIYVPASLEFEGGDSTALADKLIDSVEAIVSNAPDKFALAYSVDQMQENFKQGLISLPMGMENGSPIAGSIENLQHFYKRGIRYITLSHSLSNHISDSSYDEKRPNNGLSDFGKELVTAMNELGVMIDVSHVSDKAFYDVMEVSKVPAIASHSSARHFTPGFERNMSDDMIKKLAENGGVIFINFGSTFVHQASRDSYGAISAAVSEFMQSVEIDDSNDPKVVEWRKNYIKENPFVFADLEIVLDHFDHVIKLVGVEHVGIGSDYDGVGDTLPNGLKDAASFPTLIEGFLKRGYSESDIEKIMSGNLIRVWKQVEEYSKK
ncbi:dipeptidase [Kangiella sp. HZ709]|uniref:dipeptidase n=1 Tax=Kangiella sp. HZ709 TaxID=2666328 RepID=UPI0012AF6B86|nr:dipeptidase [Kangiella sp. HZ709]MRX26552.1 membrane dipeptidase [Kangiella sp. HZ709]